MSEELQALWDEWFACARQAGCPSDQAENFARSGVPLTPRQLVASAAARECDKEDGPSEIMVGGARSGGKSHWILAQIGVDDCQRMPGIKALFLRKIGKSAIESLLDLSKNVLRFTQHSITVGGLIEFPNGSRIITGHFNTEKDVDAYLGLEYDVIAIEEATTLSKAKLEMISTCCRTSKHGWRPRIYSSTNPGGVSHAYHKQKFVVPFREGRQTRTRFIPFTVSDNPHVNKENRETLANLSGWLRKAWHDGDWDVAAGAYFEEFSERNHVRDFDVLWPVEQSEKKLAALLSESQRQLVVPVEWFAALDYGFSHYTVALLGCCDSEGNTYIVDEHGERRWLIPAHAKAILEMLERHGLDQGDLSFFVAGADVMSRNQEGKTIKGDYEQNGIDLALAPMDRKQGWAQLLALLGAPSRNVSPRLFVHKRCRRLIQTLPEMQTNPNDIEDVLKVDAEADGSGGDDFVDALRYLLAARQKRGRIVNLKGL